MMGTWRVVLIIALACNPRHSSTATTVEEGQGGPGRGDAVDPVTVTETPIGNGRHMIRANTTKSEGLARERAYTRASTVCPGGYDVVEERVGATNTTERYKIFRRRVVSQPEVAITVQCRTTEVAPRPLPSWWCASDSTCFRDRDECTRHEQGAAVCASRAMAYCAGDRCFADLAACEAVDGSAQSCDSK